jgi:hypothetical protein
MGVCTSKLDNHNDRKNDAMLPVTETVETYVNAKCLSVACRE